MKTFWQSDYGPWICALLIITIAYEIVIHTRIMDMVVGGVL